MNQHTYLVDILVAALDRMGVRAVASRPLVFANHEDGPVSFYLFQAFPMATLVDKSSEIFQKLQDSTNSEPWKAADGLVCCAAAPCSSSQLLSATRFGTFVALLVKDDSRESANTFQMFNQTPMRRLAVSTGTGFSWLISSRRVVYSDPSTAFIQLSPMDAQLWALSPEEWRTSFFMRTQQALMSYAAPPFAAPVGPMSNVPFLPHPAPFLPNNVPSSAMFFPSASHMSPMFGLPNPSVGAPFSATPGGFVPPIMSSLAPGMSSASGNTSPDSQSSATLSSDERSASGSPVHRQQPTLPPPVVPMPAAKISHQPLARVNHLNASDDKLGLDGLAAGALASFVHHRGGPAPASSLNEEIDSEGALDSTDGDVDNNSLLFLKGVHAANQGRALEGAIRKFKNQFSKKDVITRVCKMKYRSAQRKLRIAKYIEIWPEIASMSQRAAERYISQNLKRRSDSIPAVGDE